VRRYVQNRDFILSHGVSHIEIKGCLLSFWPDPSGDRRGPLVTCWAKVMISVVLRHLRLTCKCLFWDGTIDLSLDPLFDTI
jgi:hypothetical protein